MTNTDQSNHAAASPTNSEAVRSGDWLGGKPWHEGSTPRQQMAWAARAEAMMIEGGYSLERAARETGIPVEQLKLFLEASRRAFDDLVRELRGRRAVVPVAVARTEPPSDEADRRGGKL